MGQIDFNQTPFIAIWEMTRACDLACVHCRAEAQPDRHPAELSYEEGLNLIDEIAGMGTRVLVLSGGDPTKHEYLPDLIRYGKSRNLRMGTIPAAGPNLTRAQIQALKHAGLDQMALSLDASTAAAHDRFRGVSGTFEKTIQACAWAHEAGLPLQINTVMARHNFEDVDGLIELIHSLGVVFWEVFFLVPVGRGSKVEGLTAEQYEEVFAKLYEVSRKATFIIKVTEAPHFRRYYIERRLREAGIDPEKDLWDVRNLPQELKRGSGPGGSVGRAPQGVNAGKGHVFISHLGEVYPSGFFPLSAGNVLSTNLKDIYRDAPLFQELRDPDRLKGRCGACAYRFLCGGSRSRAFALTGDYLAEDPCCAYVPSSRAGMASS